MGVEENDAVCDQPGTFAPDLLFQLRLDPKFSGIHMRNGSPQLMISLSTIDGPENMLSQKNVVNISKDVDASENTIEFPHRPLGPVPSFV